MGGAHIRFDGDEAQGKSVMKPRKTGLDNGRALRRDATLIMRHKKSKRHEKAGEIWQKILWI